MFRTTFKSSLWDTTMELYEKILELKRNNLPGVIITVINKTGHGPQIPGAKMLVDENGKILSGTIGGGALEFAALEESEKNIEKQNCYSVKYNLDENGKLQDGVKTGMICGGEITLFYEYLGTRPSLYVFGGGHVGQSLLYYMKPLGYDITLIESRENMDVKNSEACKLVYAEYEDFIAETCVPEGSMVVIMTHSHDSDYRVLKKVYESGWKAGYVGLIASKKKCVKMVEKLCEDLGGKADLSNLYTPIGLKIGGSTPADIGLSVAAELQAVRYGIEGNKHSTKNWNEALGD